MKDIKGLLISPKHIHVYKIDERKCKGQFLAGNIIPHFNRKILLMEEVAERLGGNDIETGCT